MLCNNPDPNCQFFTIPDLVHYCTIKLSAPFIFLTCGKAKGLLVFQEVLPLVDRSVNWKAVWMGQILLRVSQSLFGDLLVFHRRRYVHIYPWLCNTFAIHFTKHIYIWFHVDCRYCLKHVCNLFVHSVPYKSRQYCNCCNCCVFCEGRMHSGVSLTTAY